MRTVSHACLRDLGREFPEWRPWLTLIEEVLRETRDAKWEACVPEPLASQESTVPLLAGTKLALEITAVGGWFERLLQTAYRSGAPKMSTLNGIEPKRLNTVDLFKFSLCQNGTWLQETAIDLGVDADAFQAVTLLAPIPFLQACNRQWAPSISESWMAGYCPVCGAWPACAEMRGIERRRYLRCGRCGGGWQALCLSCAYCGMTDHEELMSLVPEKSGSNAVIDACKRCLGYVKTFTTLQGSPPAKVMVDDLASVDLDIAALEQGYRRLAGAGYALDITIVPKPSRSGRILFWRT
jgi:FdhE protein